MTDPMTLLTAARRLVVVGCSATPGKAAHDVPARLQRRGWDVVPVNPGHGEILGVQAYPRVGDVPAPIDLVVVFRPSEEAAQVAADAVAAGAGGVWLQLGITSAEARQTVTAAGLPYVEDTCTGALAERHDLHPDPT